MENYSETAEIFVEREYPSRPILGVGAVIFHNQKVLLVKRGKEPGYGKWSIPGGAVESGETLDEGILREVKEETGLDIEIGGIVKVLDSISRDENDRVKYHYVLIDFWCRSLSGELSPSSEILDARWVLPAEKSNYDLPKVTAEVIDLALSRLRAS